MTPIMEPNCSKRECIHYLGVKAIGMNEKGLDIYEHTCVAFPDGIPHKIAYEDNLHLKPLKNQGNSIVYEKKV
ncbi:MAG: hypothetical protein ACYSTS_15945 [Planctomycetota bacterium]